LRKLKDFKSALRSEKYGSCPDLFAGNHLLTAHAKTCEQMLCRRAVYGDNCGVVWVLHTIWCSRRAAHPEEQCREFGLIYQRRSSNLGFRNLAKFIGRLQVLREIVVLCWKVI